MEVDTYEDLRVQLHGAVQDLDEVNRRIRHEKALALGTDPVLPMCVPFEATTLPAYLIPAEGRADEVRPLLICTNGYDGTITDLYFASAVAASKRRYHCLVFDGPGQGGALIEQGLPLRRDRVTVVKAVVDHALTLPQVDPDRIALNGWRLGVAGTWLHGLPRGSTAWRPASLIRAKPMSETAFVRSW
jgi:hypothetical protein